MSIWEFNYMGDGFGVVTQIKADTLIEAMVHLENTMPNEVEDENYTVYLYPMKFRSKIRSPKYWEKIND